MKTIWNVLVLTLALNFLLLAGGAGWLWQSKHLDKERAKAIKEVLFPPPAPVVPATQPAEETKPEPMVQLEELLAKQSGRPAAEQLEFIRRTFDAQMTQLERRHIEVSNLQSQVNIAQARLREDRIALEAEKSALRAREQEAQSLAADKGFQDSMGLYSSMPAKQVKQIFMALDDDTLARYLRTMTPDVSKRITREFKSPQELDRIQRVLEKIRQATPATTTTPATMPAAPAGP